MGRRKERRAAASMASGRRVKLDLFAEPSSSSGDPQNKSNNQEEVEEDGVDHVNNQQDDTDEEQREGEEKRVSNSQSSSSVRWVSIQQHPSASFSRGNVARRGDGFCVWGKRPDNPLLLLGQYSDEEAIEEQITDVPLETTSADQMAQVEEFVARECGEVEDDMAKDVSVQNGKQDEFDKESTPLSVAEELAGNGIEVSVEDPLDNPQKGEASTQTGSDPGTSGVQITGEVAFGWKLVLHEESNQYYYWNVETGETSWEVPAIFAQATDLGSTQYVDPIVGEQEGTLPNADASCTLHGEPIVYSSVDAGDQCNGGYMVSNDEEQHKQADQVKVNNEGYIEECVVPEPNSGIYQGKITSTGSETTPVSIGMDEQPQLANEYHESGFALSTQLVSYAESLIQRLKDLERSNARLESWGWISKYIMEIEIRLSDFNSLLNYGSSLVPFWMHSEEKLKGLEHSINDHIAQLYGSGQTNEVATANIDESTSQETTIGGDPEVQAVALNLQNPISSPNFDTSAIQTESDGKLLVPSVNGSIKEVNETVPSSVASLEDEDMDVDMEVDDEITTNDPRSGDTLVANCIYQSEHFIQTEPSSELEKEYDDVPPPPGEEDWVPPPPPDAEPLPPPPPDDPPAPTYPTQTLSHHHPYNMLYPVSGSEYYGSMITDPNYYTHSVEPQTVDSQSAAQYYDNVSVTYPMDTSVIVNPMDPSAYYDPTVSTISSFNSSVSYPNSTGQESEAAALPSTVAKAAPTKVSRTKKRTIAVAPTLRSNKKVSSLVDKWKAAKEELHEDDEEDEPQNAYEMLERKRQREIEAWRAHQIASGEAKDNANFQPLGADWRERVKKRRRAKSASIPDADEKQEPSDSTDLPSGWQAYWDEASKKIYYGNTITSETTWIKPTK